MVRLDHRRTGHGTAGAVVLLRIGVEWPRETIPAKRMSWEGFPHSDQRGARLVEVKDSKIEEGFIEVDDEVAGTFSIAAN